MDPSNIQRLQFNVNPDSSFGAIFQLDTLVDVIPELIYPAWKEVRIQRWLRMIFLKLYSFHSSGQGA